VHVRVDDPRDDEVAVRVDVLRCLGKSIVVGAGDGDTPRRSGAPV
jgi:hypothetical protein